MKSPYEIAWNLIDKETSLSIEDISKITGIRTTNIEILKDKNYIDWFITKKINNLSLVKQVIEEIEQGKPHWEIENEL